MPAPPPADRWIDGHLDLAYVAVGGRDLRTSCGDPDRACISLPALREASIEIAFATIFTAPGHDGPAGYADPGDRDGAERAGRAQLDVYEELADAGEIALVRHLADLGLETPLPRFVLLMEGADPIRDPDAVAGWHERGLRIVGLTWAAGTRYAGGNGSGGPLTRAGRDLVDALDALGIVHDASHLSDAALDGVLEHATGRVVATHSNCRALLAEDQRHLRDDQITAIAERDGIVGLNLYTEFLAAGRRATIDDCLAHVEHVAGVMGHRRGVALGSDMDGGFGPGELPEGLEHPTRLGALAAGLAARGWSGEEIAGFRYGNWRRFLEEALPAGEPALCMKRVRSEAGSAASRTTPASPPP